MDKIVSFDIFDTLLIRQVYRPKDIFQMVADKIGVEDFKQHRIEAEINARKTSKLEDITYNQIYQNLPNNRLMLKAKEIELQLEAENLKVNPPMYELYKKYLAEGYKIIIASDMYLPTHFLASVLKNNGYNHFDKIYVSGDIGKCKGKTLFNHILSDLNVKPKDILHIGDNYSSDIMKPKSMGINVQYFPNNYDLSNGLSVFKEKKLINYYDEKNIGTSLLTKLLTKNENSNSAVNYKLGYMLGIVFYNFTKWVIKNSNDNNIFFLSRDGYLPYRIATEIFNHKKSHYIYASRRALMLCKLNLNVGISAPENKEMFDALRFLRYSKVSELIEFIGLNPNNFNDKAIEAGFNGVDDSIIPFKDNLQDINKKIWKFLELIQDDIYEYIKNVQMPNARQYFDKLNMEENDSLVDIGYFGKCQWAIEEIVQKKLNGLYFETYDFPHITKKGMKQTGYLSTGKNISCGSGAVLETFFTSNECSIRSYANGEPVFEDNTLEEKTIKTINNQLKGIFDFCKEWHAIKGQYNISDDIPRDIITRFLNEPTIEEIELFNSFDDFINGSPEFKTNLVNFDMEKINKGEIKYNFLENYWKRAYKKLLHHNGYGHLEKLL